MNSKTIALLFLSLSAALSYTACSREEPKSSTAAETVRNIAVLSVRQANVPDTVDAAGTVRAAQTSDLASQVMGNIVEMRVHEGDRVHRGDVLAVIDDAQPRAAVDRATATVSAAQHQLAAAESDLGLADSTLKRYQTLFDRKSVSPQEFDEVKTRQQAAFARRDMAQADEAQAKAALSQDRTSLEFTRIRAPFDGVVTAKRADAGALATPGLPILTIEDVRRLRLEVTVNESDLRYVRLRQALPVLIDALGDSALKGTVSEIVPSADAATRSFLVKIDLPADSHLRSGLFGHAEFSREERTSLLIPRTAVIERGQLQGVFVLDQNKVANLRYITLGKSAGTDIEVLAGLQSGERLVAKPGELDLNGKHIEAE